MDRYRPIFVGKPFCRPVTHDVPLAVPVPKRSERQEPWSLREVCMAVGLMIAKTHGWSPYVQMPYHWITLRPVYPAEKHRLAVEPESES